MKDHTGRAMCRECKASVLDMEPASTSPEFWHAKERDCSLSGRILSPGEWLPWRSKRVRRTRDRGARLARKLRP
ncbi:hypothetical protein HPC49_51760 [Pyxidicoccus fallax]|nr:hypothetical protein [Pyxidicoccus fallax]NPC86650.1 hypothetical protein [Pyxidicoccus fallax]